MNPMTWKDFLYFRKGSKIGVSLLLILILLTLILNIGLSYRDSSSIVVLQNDSITQSFEQFLTALKTIEPAPAPRPTLPSGNGATASTSTTPSPSTSTPSSSASMAKAVSESPYPRIEKLKEGETISLNAADTADWKKIPGIGDTYSTRIIEYRERLGGYVRKEQLREVYGINEELYTRIAPYIQPDSTCNKVAINHLEFKEILRHPYLNYKQVQAIMNLRRKKGTINSIRELGMLDEFTSEDIFRLEPYLQF